MRWRRRGLNLLEALIACAVAILLSMMIMNVLFPSFRLVQESQIKTELQQQGELTLQQLTADLQNSVPTGVSLAFPPTANDGMIVATHPLRKNLNAGILDFEPQLNLYYHNIPAQQVWRKIYKGGDPSGVAMPFPAFTAIQTTRANLVMISGTRNGTERSCAKSVEFFRVEKEFTSGGEVYACRIRLQKDIPGKNRKSIVELARKVMLRNHQ